MAIINLLERSETVFRARRRRLYHRLDSTTLSWEAGAEIRSEFFRKAQGEFISVLRLKKDLADLEIANFLKLSLREILDIEQGKTSVRDRDFFRLCAYLGGANEVSIFIEKLENAVRIR